MSPLTIAFTVALSLVVLTVRREHMVVPFIIAACFVPADQCAMIFDLNVYVLQILVVTAILRLAIRGETRSIPRTAMDKAVVWWAVVGTCVYWLQQLSMVAVIFKCGRLLEALGLYWVFRQTVRTRRDLSLAVTCFATCCLVMTPFVLLEWGRGSNPFVMLGRVTTEIREGAYRCQGPFPHAIIMGLFWATLLPTFLAEAKNRDRKFLFWTAAAMGTVMVVSSASSTPLLTMLANVVLLVCFRFRRHTSTALYGLMALIVALHIVMQGPVWHLLSRVGMVSGSTAWYRFNLVDQTINHFGEWALLGIRSTAHWGLLDITNQYILEGVRGGLITLVLFLVVIYRAGQSFLHESLASVPRKQGLLAWTFFSSLVGHCVAFWGVAYFGQIMMLWFLQLAIAALLSEKGVAPVVCRENHALQ